MAPVPYHLGGFPPPELDWQQLIPLLGPANASLARYDGLLEGIPNPAVLLSPLSSQEAVLSSRIEGTQATLAEVLEYEADAEASTLPQDRRDDIREVQNYRQAMRQAQELLVTLPLSLRLIKNLHATLLSGVRGNDKAPGEFRKIPNWIGPRGCTIEDARFVPISADKLDAAMGSWASFIHAEFESLHPFLDGNGRIGRMVLPLLPRSRTSPGNPEPGKSQPDSGPLRNPQARRPGGHPLPVRRGGPGLDLLDHHLPGHRFREARRHPRTHCQAHPPLPGERRDPCRDQGSQRPAPPGALPGAAAGRCGGAKMTPSLWIMKP